MKKKNYGLVIKKRDPRNLILGGLRSLPKVVVVPDGQHDAFKPAREIQHNHLFDSHNCTGYGWDGAIEFDLNRQGVEVGDKSDRRTGIKAKTKPPGNDPRVVAQAIHENGVVAESSLPFNSDIKTVEEYYSYKGGEEWKCDLEGQDFLKKFEFRYEELWNRKPSKEDRIKIIKECLQYSVIPASFSAWTLKDGVYVDDGKPNNHWAIIYGWTDRGWKVFDSYDNSEKIVSFDHKIDIAMRFMLIKQATQEEIGIVMQILRKMSEWLGLITATETLPKVITPPIAPVVAPQPQPEPPQPKYLWDTPILARHSVRVICDEEGLTLSQKNELCATVGAESGWQNTAKLENKKNGKTWSTDWGICQINDHYHIGKGKSFPSVEYVLDNPDQCIRWMCKQWKAGNKTWWVAYKNGSYKKYL